MASIVSIRTPRVIRSQITAWLAENCIDCVIDHRTVTFLNDDDAMIFCLKFGLQPITYSPEK